MKNSKTVLSIMLTVLFMVTAAAQSKDNTYQVEKLAKGKTEYLASYLKLNKYQKRAVLKLNRIMAKRLLKRAEKINALTRGGRELTRSELTVFKKMESEDKLTTERKLKKTLTKEQYRKWKAKFG